MSCGRCVILPDSCRCLTQYYKAITLQLKIFFKKKKKRNSDHENHGAGTVERHRLLLLTLYDLPYVGLR